MLLKTQYWDLSNDYVWSLPAGRKIIAITNSIALKSFSPKMDVPTECVSKVICWAFLLYFCWWNSLKFDSGESFSIPLLSPIFRETTGRPFFPPLALIFLWGIDCTDSVEQLFQIFFVSYVSLQTVEYKSNWTDLPDEDPLICTQHDYTIPQGICLRIHSQPIVQTHYPSHQNVFWQVCLQFASHWQHRQVWDPSSQLLQDTFLVWNCDWCFSVKYHNDVKFLLSFTPTFMNTITSITLSVFW